MTTKQEHFLACLAEEAGEVVQAVGKILRFGLDDKHPKTGDVPNRVAGHDPSYGAMELWVMDRPALWSGFTESNRATAAWKATCTHVQPAQRKRPAMCEPLGLVPVTQSGGITPAISAQAMTL